jgi:hypothetical protein
MKRQKTCLTAETFYSTLKSSPPPTFTCCNVSITLLQHIFSYLPEDDLIQMEPISDEKTVDRAPYTNSTWYYTSRSWPVWKSRSLNLTFPAARTLVTRHQNEQWTTRAATVRSPMDRSAAIVKWFHSCASHLIRLELTGFTIGTEGPAKAVNLQTLCLPFSNLSSMGNNEIAHPTVQTVFLTIDQMSFGGDWIQAIKPLFPVASRHVFVRSGCQPENIHVCLSKTPNPDMSYMFPGDDPRHQSPSHWLKLIREQSFLGLQRYLSLVWRLHEETKGVRYCLCLQPLHEKEDYRFACAKCLERDVKMNEEKF